MLPSRILQKPKSPNLIFPLERKMLSGFRSLCMTLFLLSSLKASRSCLKQRRASDSVRNLRFLRRVSMVPPLQYSQMKQKLLGVLRVSTNLMMQSFLREERMLISLMASFSNLGLERKQDLGMTLTANQAFFFWWMALQTWPQTPFPICSCSRQFSTSLLISKFNLKKAQITGKKSQLLSLFLIFIFLQKVYMSKALQLQNKLEMLNDEVKDLFHATQINLEALTVEANHKNSSKQLISVIHQCQGNFKYLQTLLDERSSLRLNYLITEQIKEEQAKVRRERLNDYEDKILDQRRLISDKESFYENLLRPKKKRPPNMPLEEFQQLRRKEISDEQNRKYKWLKEEVDRLTTLYGLLKQENCKMAKRMKEEEAFLEKEEELKEVVNEVEKDPSLYDKVSPKIVIPETINEEELELFKAIKQLRNENSTLVKEYMQQKEMYQYLKWENKKLIEQYRQQEDELKEVKKTPTIKPSHLFDRPVSR